MRYTIASLMRPALVSVSILFLLTTVWGQGFTNTISGRVVGMNRQPLRDINVELLDDLSRTISRTRTNGSGSYYFSGMPSGRYTVKVLPYGTDYEEQENSVEIINITKDSVSGEYSDFSLKLKKGVTLANAIALFAQEVPPNAKILYEKGLKQLDDKNTKQAHENLRAAIEAFPKYYAALERLGTEYIQMARPETYRAAEILLATAVEINPRGYRSWYGLAYARYSLGSYPEALTAAQKAVELNGAAPEASFLTGALMRHTDKFAESEKLLLKAKELSKDSIPSVHWELALLYGNNLNRYAEAAKELKLFLKAQPEAKDSEKIKKLISDFEAKAQSK